jgi:hypothetical protein
MAYSEVLHSITLEADASITEATGVPGTPGSSEPNSGKQYRFVKVTAAKTVGLATGAANELVAGILQSKPQVLGQAATVALAGVSLCEAAGTIGAGLGVKCDGTGKAVLWVTGTDDENLRLGVAVTAGASGALFACLIRNL